MGSRSYALSGRETTDFAACRGRFHLVKSNRRPSRLDDRVSFDSDGAISRATIRKASWKCDEGMGIARYIVHFEDASKDDHPRLGGKCAGLATLIAAGAAVPTGFAVTTDAYADMLAAHGLRRRNSETDRPGFAE